MKSFIPLAVAAFGTVAIGIPVAASARVPNDPLLSQQAYLAQVGAEGAWEVATGTRSVVVAVIDTGVDIYHEDLKDNIWTNPGEIIGNGKDDDGNGFVDDVYGWNFVAGTNDVRPWGDSTDEDAYVHGTLVASIIAAKGDNGIGIAGLDWNAKIMSLVALDRSGSGSTTNVARAVRYAVSNGADIINLSIEGDVRDPDLDQALAFARSKGVLSVVVAGNGGKNLSEEPVYPACAAPDGMYGTVTVSAVDAEDRKAEYADYGSCVDLVAPGNGIFAARPKELGKDGQIITPAYDGGFNGTSVAAPIVSGVAALLKSVHPTWGATELRNKLIASTVPIDSLNDTAYRGGLGRGRIDARLALTSAFAPTSTAVGASSTGMLELEASRPGEETRLRISSNAEILEFAPFDPSNRQGANAAFSDLDNDGVPEVGAVAASGKGSEVVIFGRDGQLRARIPLSKSFADGAIIVGVSGGFVVADASSGTAWGISSGHLVRSFFPYGASYAGGLDLLAAGGAAAFVPRNGGGRLVVTDVNGTQLVSAFPFGTGPSGRWSLARTLGSSSDLIVSGPEGTKKISTSAMGQIGWESVPFSDLEHLSFTSSDGRPGSEPAYRLEDDFRSSF